MDNITIECFSSDFETVNRKIIFSIKNETTDFFDIYLVDGDEPFEIPPLGKLKFNDTWDYTAFEKYAGYRVDVERYVITEGMFGESKTPLIRIIPYARLWQNEHQYLFTISKYYDDINLSRPDKISTFTIEKIDDIVNWEPPQSWNQLDFVEGFLEKNPDVDLRLMFIANRIDPLRKSFLERRGYEYLEIHASKFMELAKKHNMIEEEESFENVTHTLTSRTPIIMNIDQDEIGKREKFISYKGTKNEKEFWKIFFEEIDNRSFVKSTFQVAEFGVHVTNKKHFNSSGGKYSLMFTRRDSFKMNDLSFQGQSWNGLNRMKNWCITINLPEKFYSELRAKNLLSGEQINVPLLLKTFTPTQLNEELFKCIDLFR